MIVLIDTAPRPLAFASRTATKACPIDSIHDVRIPDLYGLYGLKLSEIEGCGEDVALDTAVGSEDIEGVGKNSRLGVGLTANA